MLWWKLKVIYKVLNSCCGSVVEHLGLIAGRSAFIENNNGKRCCSSVVEHFLGKEEVGSSILLNSSTGVGLGRVDTIHCVEDLKSCIG